MLRDVRVDPSRSREVRWCFERMEEDPGVHRGPMRCWRDGRCSGGPGAHGEYGQEEGKIDTPPDQSGGRRHPSVRGRQADCEPPEFGNPAVVGASHDSRCSDSAKRRLRSCRPCSHECTRAGEEREYRGVGNSRLQSRHAASTKAPGSPRNAALVLAKMVHIRLCFRSASLRS